MPLRKHKTFISPLLTFQHATSTSGSLALAFGSIRSFCLSVFRSRKKTEPRPHWDFLIFGRSLLQETADRVAREKFPSDARNIFACAPLANFSSVFKPLFGLFGVAGLYVSKGRPLVWWYGGVKAGKGRSAHRFPRYLGFCKRLQKKTETENRKPKTEASRESMRSRTTTQAAVPSRHTTRQPQTARKAA